MAKATRSSTSFTVVVEDLTGDGPFPGAKVAELEYEISFTYTPGDPGCRYTKNGDGWPPSGPEVDWSADLLNISADDRDGRPTTIENDTASHWLEESDEAEELRDKVHEACLEQISTDMEPDDDRY